MIADVFRDALAGTSRRLLFTSALPALVFSSVLLGITLEAANGAHPAAEPGTGLGTAIATWSDRPGSVRTVHAAGFVLAVTLLTALLAAHRVTLLRWAEGYWPGRLGRRLGAWRASRHERARAQLRGDVRAGSPDAYETLYLRFPLPGLPVLPTRLGNVLRGAEDYPRTRYGIDAVLVWPRLFPLLPAPFTAAFASSRARLDAALAATALSGAFTVAAPVCTVVTGGAPWLAVGSLAAGALGALTGYRAALTAAVVHGQQVRVAFDLYRGLLLDTARHGGRPPLPEAGPADPQPPFPRPQPQPLLQQPQPAPDVLSSAAEREIWEGLCGFWYRNIPVEARVAAPRSGG
ncbi:hypothetical protein ACFWAA_19325 [Streptomyces sp. NPDC059922]|uniref:hypothetical protein n=1 Tax=Streptomyces sp. NPDC059922 TaxID=3347005 RepID=UPI00365BB8BE